MTPYYSDDSVTLWHGDAIEVMRDLPADSVDCIVTSPPYYGLRDYGTEGQYGLEESPAAYVETMRALFAEARRVLAADGTLWLNIGDSYASTTKGTGGVGSSTLVGTPAEGNGQHFAGGSIRLEPGVPSKNLLGIPWRLAFALQDDGWILRNDVIWAKPNAMPESVTDRLSTKHEHLFMLTKRARYWFDLDPIREEPRSPSFKGGGNQLRSDSFRQSAGDVHRGLTAENYVHDNGRNPGDVWNVPTQPYPGAHFAVMPQALASRCIQAGCKPGGTVLDPFSGSGTTGLAAAKHGRRYVGIDLNPEYLELSLKTRLAQPALMEMDLD